MLAPKPSKFKNAFGEPCTKNQWFTNLVSLHKATSGDGYGISANEDYFCVPWAAGAGSVLVHPRKGPYKVPDDPPCIIGHKDLILDTQFSPFKSNLLATGSNDGTVKLWSIPEGGLKKNLSQDMVTFQHEKKVNLVSFSPTVEHALLTTSLDTKLRLWDINHPKDALREIEGHKDVIQSLSWNFEAGALVTSCRDGIARVIDPRTKTTLVSGMAHDSSKGFKAVWLQKKEQFITVGFNKTQGREIALWDLRRGLKKGCISRTVMDNMPTQCFLFYDYGNSLLYCAGKADTTIKLFEITEDAPCVNFLSEYKSKESQSGLCMLPQRFNNVYKNEVASFMKLTGKGEVKSVHFSVPRKDDSKRRSTIVGGLEKKQSHQRITSIGAEFIFHEDIHPEVFSGEPSISLAEWLKGNEKPQKTISMKKENMTSIYELPIEDGGKLRPTTEIFFGTGSFSGLLLRVSDSDWSKRDKLFVSIKPSEIVFSLNKDSTPNESILMTSISSVYPVLNSSSGEDESLWFQIATFDKMIYLICENPNDQKRWIETLRKNVNKFHEEKPYQEEFGYSMTNITNKITGWNQRFVHMTPKNMLVFSNRKQTVPLLKISFTDVASVQDIPDVRGIVEEEAKVIFQITKKNGDKILFQATSESQRDYWYEYIMNILNPNSEGDSLLVSLGLERGTNDKKKSRDIQYKISISPISSNLGETDIKELLQVFGKIENVIVHRGGKPFKIDTAIVSFYEQSACENACSLHGSTIDNSKVSVLPYFERESINPLYIKVENLTPDITYLDIKSIFTAFGELEHVHKWPTKENCTVYAKYKDRDESKNALQLDHVKLYGREISVVEVVNPREEEIFLNELLPSDVKIGKVPILIQMKGKKRIRSRRVEFGKINSSDVFILDMGTKIYQWNGKKASKFKKARGLDVLQNLKMKERAGGAKTYICDEGGKTPEEAEVYKILGVDPTTIPLNDGKTDDGEEVVIDKNTTLYRLTELQGVIKVKRIATNQALSKWMLKTEYVYILDCFSELFIWEGQKANTNLKKMAKKIMMKLQENDKRPLWTQCVREIEMGETVLFKEKFVDFPSLLPIAMSQKSSTSQAIQQAVQKKITKQDLISMKEHDNSNEMYDDGSGTIMIWKVEGFEKVEYPKNFWGHFYSGDSYIVLYTYKKNMSNYQRNILYYWQGRDCTINEKGAAALIAVKISEKQEGESLLVRVLQQKESKHFLLLFKSLVVHLGKFKNVLYENDVLDIRESNTGNVRAVGCVENVPSFGIVANFASGKFKVTPSSSVTKKEVDYAKIITSSTSSITSFADRPNRLWVMSAKTGVIDAIEIYDFCQDDLDDNEVYLLDTPTDLWCWFGTKSPFFARKFALEVGFQFEKKFWVVKSINEPEEFKLMFQSWGKHKFKNFVKQTVAIQKMDAQEIYKEFSRKTYPYNDLLSDKLPEGVDPGKLETYLTEEEFSEVFGMERSEYNKIPGYKQQELKKKVYLF